MTENLEARVVPAKTIVKLYEVNASGHQVVYDIWDYSFKDKWRESQGIYSSKSSAEASLNELIEKYRKDKYHIGEKQVTDSDIMIEVSLRNSEATLTLMSFEVNKKRIAVDGDGNMFYKGERIL